MTHKDHSPRPDLGVNLGNPAPGMLERAERLLDEEDFSQEPAPEPCAYETRRATLVDPPEFCDEEAVPGSDYCKGHDPDAYEDYLVEQAESRREMEMER